MLNVLNQGSLSSKTTAKGGAPQRDSGVPQRHITLHVKLGQTQNGVIGLRSLVKCAYTELG